jgi:tetratricopeptide (TPR) repeat protein
MTYAYLQRGQYREADAIRRQILALNGPYSAVQPTAMAFAFAAIPARCALERHAWGEAAALPLRQPARFPWGDAFVHADSMLHFARGLGAARSGQHDLARRELAELERIQDELADAKRPAYWIAQAETQVLAIRAWIEFDASHPDAAVALMRRAVQLEATTNKEAVTPGEVLPAGDLLGDMLLEANRADEALATFEATLASSPNRLNTLHGAGLAAERTGDTAKARSYYGQLVKVAASRDSTIPAVEHAEAYLKQNGTGVAVR